MILSNLLVVVNERLPEMKKLILSLGFLIILTAGSSAQALPATLASTRFKKYTLADISSDARHALLNVDSDIANQRKELLTRQLGELLVQKVAASLGISVAELKKKEITSQVSDPTDAQVKAYYEQNKSSDSGALETERPGIEKYLRWQAEQASELVYFAVLEKKYQVTRPKDVNAAVLLPNDVLASFGGQSITVRQFDEKNRTQIWATRADAYETVIDELERAMFSDLLAIEAKKAQLSSGEEYLKRTTNGIADADDNLKDQLFAKYNAEVALTRPQLHCDFSIDGAPYLGGVNAKVAVVMFTDFQCSHCAKAAPMVERVTAEFGTSVKFAVKSYPLTSIHPNAFRAAEAAAAAQEQGKFFEYAELLYKNQDLLSDDQLKKFASDLGLDRKRFDEGLSTGRFAPKVKKEMADGDRIGLLGTPTVFVNGAEIYAPTPRNLRLAIKRALNRDSQSSLRQIPIPR